MSYLDEYYKLFDEFPPLLQTFTYSGEVYQNLMKDALNYGEKITKKTIANYLIKNKIKYDVVE